SSSDYTTYPYSITAFLVYNFQDSNATIKKALNNAKIRQAISLSINRKTLVKNVIGDASTVSKTFVPQDLVK
ncbi:peptide ABC transporter substrate-binding protein, partial [Salmonella enterica subsp. enterica serovar Enteritidis]